MDYYVVKRLALILAIQAEVEGMKAENIQRNQIGYSLAYSGSDFCSKAEELRSIANCPEELL